jgi:hypothetical protein
MFWNAIASANSSHRLPDPHGEHEHQRSANEDGAGRFHRDMVPCARRQGE